jgi:hypothetical protein
MSHEDRTVDSWPKNSQGEVRATLGQFNSHRLASIRVYASNDDGDDDHPTKKGISIKVSDLPHLLAAVEALIEAEQGKRAA